MKVAVFGGSGFLGYDFVRLALSDGSCIPVVYSSSAKSLSNVARHEVDIRLYPSADPAAVTLDADVDLLINFSHPFERRDGISGLAQVQRFADFVGRARQRNPRLRLIHTSSMSVYEPFAPGIEFQESAQLRAPRHDRYAREKIVAEQALRALPDAASWQLHLRPTVVYGPFCGVWTDNVFAALMADTLHYHSLAGRIQPLLGADVSRFILARVTDFRAGTYNLAGPETVTWQAFFTVFQEIAARGKLRHVAGAAGGDETLWRFYARNLRELLHAVRKEPSFDRMALSIARHLPDSAVQRVRGILLGHGDATAAASSAQVNGDYLRPFFAEDRLVSTTRLAHDFPEFKPQSLAASREQLTQYFHYRFSDESFVPAC